MYTASAAHFLHAQTTLGQVGAIGVLLVGCNVRDLNPEDQIVIEFRTTKEVPYRPEALRFPFSFLNALARALQIQSCTKVLRNLYLRNHF